MVNNSDVCDLSVLPCLQVNDMPFAKFKALIEDPASQVRPEVQRKFMKIISNLEEGNVSFLYELFHSIIDFKSSQIIVLRKKVEKSSPFGKFLRMVLMNVRRMSYPQVHYLYRQLCAYVGDFMKMRKKSIGVIPSEVAPRKSAATSVASTPTSTKSDKEDPLAITSSPAVTPTTPVVLSEIPTPGTSKSIKSITKLSQQQPNPYKFRGLEIFQRMTDRSRKNVQSSLGFDIFAQYTTEYKRATGKWNLAQERELQKAVVDKKRRVAVALEGTKSLRNLWQTNPLLRSASQASLDSIGDIDSSGFGGRSATKRRSGGRQISIPQRMLPPRSPRKCKTSQYVIHELNPLTERDEGYFPSDDDESMGPPSTINVPVTPKSPRSKSKKGFKKSPAGFGSSALSFDNSAMVAGSAIENKSTADRAAKELPASRRWEQIKWWSRKQIERALKMLANDLLNTSQYSYSPKDISTFVEMVILNPSAQILLSQIVSRLDGRI